MQKRPSLPAQRLKSGCDAATDAALEVLIKAITLKDRRALSDLYECTSALMYRVAKAVLKSNRDAEEIVCDLFMFVWEHADRYDSKRGSVVVWLSTIARYRAIDRLRRRWRGTETDALTDEITTTWQGPDEMVESLQAGAAVHRALNQLSPLPRKLLRLAFFENLTHVEMADVLGMPLGTLKSSVRRSLRKMRATMA